MKIITVVGIVISWFVAVFIGWLVFFVAAPFLCGLLPQNEWTGLGEVAIYIVVGSLGGVGIPIQIGFLGTMISITLLGD